MVSTDENLLIYAYDEASQYFEAARDWLEHTFSGGDEFGIPIQSILACLRVHTHSSLPNPYSFPEALRIVDGWLSRKSASLLPPGPYHWTIFRDLCVEVNASGRLTTDVHLAALAIEHGAAFYSADRDFARFIGLDWRNPLVPKS